MCTKHDTGYVCEYNEQKWPEYKDDKNTEKTFIPYGNQANSWDLCAYHLKMIDCML